MQKDELTTSTVNHHLQVFQDSLKKEKPKSKNGGKTTDKSLTASEKDDNRSKTRKRVMECYNCGRRHAGGERQCKAPCKLCGQGTHTRYHCPERKQNMKKNNNGHDKRERETAAFAKVVSEFAKNLESYMKKPESSSEEEEISFDFSYTTKDKHHGSSLAWNEVISPKSSSDEEDGSHPF